uniref:AUGMIN subunit 8 n=1 Tax=Oryza meridionalis TaxID=40149 RepID=A0A0E0CSG8_9ORYZ
MDACGIRAPGDVLLRKSELSSAAAAAAKNYGNGHDDAAVRRRAAAGSPATPRRHPSPNAGRSSATDSAGSQARRSQSTERRPATPSRLSPGGSRAAALSSRISAPTSPSSAPSSPSSSSSSSSTPVRDAVAAESQSAPRRLAGGRAPPDGLWPSMRSLSSSLQLEAKGKRTNGGPADHAKARDAGDRKRSPSRGRSAAEQQPENPHAKVIDHHRWPAMMGGRVSVSAMSRSVDLTDKISRPALSSIPSRGVSPKKATMASATNALTRSIDLADKIDRLVSLSVSSPRTPTASNGAADESKSMSVSKGTKPAAVAIPSRVSAIRTATSGGIRALSKSIDLTEKDIGTLSSAASSPGISPSVSVSSMSNATSQTTAKSTRGLSPRRTSTSIGSGALSRNIDLPENDKRPASSSASLRGNSPRRRLASDSVNAVVKNIDFAEKDSRAAISSTSSRGFSPRRRLASDGLDAISRSTDFSDKDSRPSTSSSSAQRGISPLRRLTISKGTDFTDKSYRPSTSSAASRGVSPRTRLASDSAGNILKNMDLADRDNKPSTSSASLRGMSPRRRLASDGISKNITFTEKDDRTMLSSVASQEISTIRCLPSDGADSISKNIDLPEKVNRPATSSAASRGLSPRRRLASDGVNAISKSIDLADKDTGPARSTAALRGVSPRRQLASDRVDSISKNTDFTEKDKDSRPSTSSGASRGISPRRRLASDGVDDLSKGINFSQKIIRPSTSSMASRGTSPRRQLASDGVNALLKSTDFTDKDHRPSTSSAALRGMSPRNRVTSKSIDAKSLDFSDKDSRPFTPSGASQGTLQEVALASDGINALSEAVDTAVIGSLQSTSSIESGETSDARLNNGSGTVVNRIDFAQEVNIATPDGCNGHISESMDSHDIGTSAPSMSITSQEQSPSRTVSNGPKTLSDDINATKKDNRAMTVKIPSRGASPRRRLASEGFGTISKSMDFSEKERTSINMATPSRGMSPRRTARSGIVDMSKSMDFSEKCNGPISSIAPSRVVSARRILGPDGANAMSRSMDLTDKIRQPISSTVRKMSLADSRAKAPDLLSGDVESPGSANGNESQEENAGSSLDAPSNDSEKSAPPKRLARTLSSPSPTKASSISSFTPRRMPSPSRNRPSTPVSPCSSTRSDSASSILSYMGDVTRGKRSPSHMEDAHQLRLLYNRSLQWRFTNAYVDEMQSVQKMSAETMLYSVWDANSSLCDSMVMKRSYVQRLRQEVKLGVVLKEQMDYLTHWAALETEHSTSLSSAIEALRASTLRLPVTGGSKADVFTVKNAVSSAVDIMQAMGSSVCYLLSKLQATHSLVTELSAVAANESSMLNEYRELLGTAAALQVQESSLRTQLIQETE